MPARLATLKQICLTTCQRHLKRLDSLGDEGLLPQPVLAALLKHTLPDGLTRLEQYTPWLASTAEAQEAWRSHVLRVFPESGETYDLTDPQLDWRAAFAFLQAERKKKEEASRARLRAQYRGLDAGKQGKQIKKLEQAPVVPGRRRGGTGSAGGSRGSGGGIGKSSLMGKAMKGASLATMRVHAGKPKPLPKR